MAASGRCKAATDILPPTLRNFFFFLQTLADNVSFTIEDAFLLCRRKNLQRRSARFFRSSGTEVVFRPTPACFHLLGKENISQPRQKNMIHRH